jgi:hypothetical protein
MAGIQWRVGALHNPIGILPIRLGEWLSGVHSSIDMQANKELLHFC